VGSRTSTAREKDVERLLPRSRGILNPRSRSRSCARGECTYEYQRSVSAQADATLVEMFGLPPQSFDPTPSFRLISLFWHFQRCVLRHHAHILGAIQQRRNCTKD
jgi:hypothetical protein